MPNLEVIQIKSINLIKFPKPNIRVKRSLFNVCVILDDITFSEIYINITLANTHEDLGKYH